MSEGGSNTNFNGNPSPSDQAYYEFACEMPMDSVEKQEVDRRLKDRKDVAHFEANGYATIEPKSRTFDAAWKNLSRKEVSVAGISIDSIPVQTGLGIPVRTLAGGASSIVVRDHKKGYRFLKSRDGGTVKPLTHISHITGRNKQNNTPIVRVTEGILKADIADLYGDVPCIGIHGVGYLPKDFANILKILGVGELRIALDVEENGHTDRMRLEIYRLATGMGITPVMETWDQRYKGIDDALVAGVEIETIDPEDIEKMERKAGLDLVYIKKLAAFANLSDNDTTYYKSEAVSMYYGMLPKELRDRIQLGSIKRVEGVDVFPGERRRIVEDTLNLWRAPREYRITDKAIERRLQRALLRHLLFLIPKKTERRIFMQWAAHIATRPADRVRWAVILFSEAQQTGKTSTVMALAKAVGENNFNAVSNDVLKTRFNAPLSGKQLILINEVYHRDSYGVVNRLKELITDDILSIEQKYMPVTNVRNVSSFILTTNNEDALKISPDDRRFMAIQCSEVQASKEHYTELAWAIAHPWCGQVIRDMAAKMNMENFDAKSSPIRTETTERFIAATRSAGEEWAYDVVQGNQWPGDVTDILSMKQLQFAMKDPHISRLACFPKHLMEVKKNTIGKWLNQSGAKSRKVLNPHTRKTETFVILRNHKEWFSAPGTAFFPTTMSVVGEDGKGSLSMEEKRWGDFKALPLPSEPDIII
jgi:hypothetical protein